MKFLRQCSIIFAATAAGELMRFLIPLPVPASIYGLVILLLLLIFGVVRVEQVKDAGNFLIEVMPVMFIAPATTLIAYWAQIKSFFVPFVTIVLVSTVLVLGLTGKATDLLLDRRAKKGEAQNG
ncbi:MAG: CidA/LrgA family protein [Pyramidobacter sp.]|nr:CidA/LrgA family protein [Pyramidobacter sp.]